MPAEDRSHIAAALLSGGLDSMVAAALAKERGQVVHALTIDYGQRHRREIEAARAIASALDLASHSEISLDLRQFGGSALTADIDVPKGGVGEDIPVTYVPARNLVFLALTTAFAETRGAGRIVIGVNALDYSGYPDCRPEFFQKMGESLGYGSKLWTEYHVPLQIEIPIIEMSKADIVRLAMELEAPLELTWSCYQGGEIPCGRCDSCILRASGFSAAGYPDPAVPD